MSDSNRQFLTIIFLILGVSQHVVVQTVNLAEDVVGNHTMLAFNETVLVLDLEDLLP